MHVVEIVIIASWTVFWVGWLAAAFGTKSGRTNWGPSIGVRLVLFALIVILERVPGLRVHRGHSPALAAIGLALFVLGLSVAVWARVHLGRNWGTPMTQKADPELVTTGPYRWVRNPIYSGIILALIGTALALSVQLLVIVVLIGGYFVYSAVMEQRFMAERFPDTYPAYRDATKMLIPFVF